jgi:spermidine synthase
LNQSKQELLFQSLTLPLYVAVAFLSAALLFTIELGVGKQLLPLMGGAPATWNTCILFFQAMVVIGACYVWALRSLSFQWQIAAQAALYLAALATLPIWVSSANQADLTPGAASALRILVTSAALASLALTSTSLLLQEWLTRNNVHTNPYRIYAGSNVGSLAALLAYPFLIEPRFGLRLQSSAWSIELGIIAILLAGCAFLAYPARGSLRAEPIASVGAKPAVAERLRWCLLAFIPASLLAGTNTYITSDVAPAPLLWVFPLAAYLLSLIIPFAMRRERRSLSGAGGQLVFLTAWLVLTFLHAARPVWLGFTVAVALLFFSGLVCHVALAASRPSSDRRAEFYIFITLGGLLGTAFNVLVAPGIFVFNAEYPLALLAACYFRRTFPSERTKRFDSRRELFLLALFFLFLFAAVTSGALPRLIGPDVLRLAIGLGIAAMLVRYRDTPAGMVLAVCAVLLAGAAAPDTDGRIWYRTRNFLGDLQARVSPDGRFKTLWHGTTIHGAEEIGKRPEPLLYYVRPGPLGQVFSSIADLRPARTIGVIGLGVGSASAYAIPGQRWFYYDINPAVRDLATDGHSFTFLTSWTPDATVTIGDARLSLQRARDSSFDLLVVDAFNSDAIPIHLLTEEAFRLYERKLAPQGLVALHISNRYLDLERVVDAEAMSTGVVARVQTWYPSTADIDNPFVRGSRWVVLGRTDGDLGSLATDPRWRPLKGAPMRQWTDDFSDVASIMNWRQLTTK